MTEQGTGRKKRHVRIVTKFRRKAKEIEVCGVWDEVTSYLFILTMSVSLL